MAYHYEEESSHSFLWFLAGLGIGAVAGMLYAPAAGAETRENIRNKAMEGRDYMTNTATKVRDTANQWADRGKNMYANQKDQFRSAFEAGRSAYEQATGSGTATAGTTAGQSATEGTPGQS